MKDSVLQRVIELISSLNLSKNAFASQIGMEQTTVNNQLIGKRSISIDLILNILSSFPEVNAEWLMRGEGNMLKSDKDLQKVTEKEFTVVVDENGFLKLKR